MTEHAGQDMVMPTGKFSISSFRVFGPGSAEKPGAVKEFILLRTLKDKRSAWLKWCPVDNAYAYNIYMGTEPDKLCNSIMVYNANEYWLKTLDKEKPYYFTIEAINKNGISKRSPIQKAD